MVLILITQENSCDRHVGIIDLGNVNVMASSEINKNVIKTSLLV
jgi:hypothetical protein